MGNDKDPGNIWIVLHGYGHLAKYFIQKFDSLDLQQQLVICPEALSKFYLSGSAGRVGASWMTRHEREDDIKDYINYLDQIYSTYVDPILPQKSVKIHVIGFSQGGATASRWFARTKHKIDSLILWGSIFPPDMHIENIAGKHVPIFVLLGDNDKYLPLSAREKTIEDLNKLGISYELIEYSGGHDIYQEPLRSLTRKLA